MTAEELLNLSVEELEAMSDKQLEAHFEPYLKTTRPDLVKKQGQLNLQANGVGNMGRKQEASKTTFKDEKMQKARELAKKFGIDL